MVPRHEPEPTGAFSHGQVIVRGWTPSTFLFVFRTFRALNAHKRVLLRPQEQERLTLATKAPSR